MNAKDKTKRQKTKLGNVMRTVAEVTVGLMMTSGLRIVVLVRYTLSAHGEMGAWNAFMMMVGKKELSSINLAPLILLLIVFVPFS
jgi:hypothetical protein